MHINLVIFSYATFYFALLCIPIDFFVPIKCHKILYFVENYLFQLFNNYNAYIFNIIKALKDDYNHTNMEENVEIYTNWVTFSEYHLQQTVFQELSKN